MAGLAIDLKQLKQEVSLEQVLTHYGLRERLRKKKDSSWVGKCPFHTSKGKSEPFSADLERGGWRCWSSKCKGHAGGNLFDLVMLYEDVNLRRAAELITEWFYPERLAGKRTTPTRSVANAIVPELEPAFLGTLDVMPTPAGNIPYGKPLKSLDLEHGTLSRLKLERETLTYFGIGYCMKGQMKGRIAIPIHNQAGELVSYLGRATTKPQLDKDGQWLAYEGFDPSLELFNIHNLVESLATNTFEPTLIITTDILDALRLWDTGFDMVLALMGEIISSPQLEIVKDVCARYKVEQVLYLPTTLNPATAQTFITLGEHLWVKLCPTDKPLYSFSKANTRLLLEPHGLTS